MGSSGEVEVRGFAPVLMGDELVGRVVALAEFGMVPDRIGWEVGRTGVEVKIVLEHHRHVTEMQPLRRPVLDVASSEWVSAWSL